MTEYGIFPRMRMISYKIKEAICVLLNTIKYYLFLIKNSICLIS